MEPDAAEVRGLVQVYVVTILCTVFQIYRFIEACSSELLVFFYGVFMKNCCKSYIKF